MLDEMKSVIHYHDHKEQQYRGNHGGFVYRFEKTVDSKRLVVVAEIWKSEAWILTGFYIP